MLMYFNLIIQFLATLNEVIKLEDFWISCFMLSCRLLLLRSTKINIPDLLGGTKPTACTEHRLNPTHIFINFWDLHFWQKLNWKCSFQSIHPLCCGGCGNSCLLHDSRLLSSVLDIFWNIPDKPRSLLLSDFSLWFGITVRKLLWEVCTLVLLWERVQGTFCTQLKCKY